MLHRDAVNLVSTSSKSREVERLHPALKRRASPRTTGAAERIHCSATSNPGSDRLWASARYLACTGLIELIDQLFVSAA